jgi:ribosome maturation factor RimP
MQTDTAIQTIEKMINTLMVNDPKHFLVEVKVKPANNFKIFIDGDEGVPLSVLVTYNRRLYKMVEENGLYPEGDFSLEVSSPGLDEPLKMNRQYKKNIGRFVDVLLNDTAKREGKLLEVTEDGIIVEWEEGKGKNKTTKQESILFSDIKTTKIQIKF